MHRFDQLCLTKSTCFGTSGLYATLPVGCICAAYGLLVGCRWLCLGCLWAAWAAYGPQWCCICATYGLPFWVAYEFHTCCTCAAYGLLMGCLWAVFGLPVWLPVGSMRAAYGTYGAQSGAFEYAKVKSAEGNCA